MIVSPRPKPEDNPVAGTQTWSKRALPPVAAAKSTKSVAVLDVKIVAAQPLDIACASNGPW